MVNGTPVYFDGFSAEDLSFAYSGQAQLELDFGLENLNFKGDHRGFDQVNLSIDFLQDQQVVQHYSLNMLHAALRSSETTQKQVVDNASFTWSSKYWKSVNENEYETFVGSNTDPAGAEKVRHRIDQCGLSHNGSRVFGVVRPPLGDNPYYGITVGLENQSGQIQFTFNKKDESALRKWVKQQASAGICKGGLRKDAYRYRIGLK